MCIRDRCEGGGCQGKYESEWNMNDYDYKTYEEESKYYDMKEDDSEMEWKMMCEKFGLCGEEEMNGCPMKKMWMMVEVMCRKDTRCMVWMKKMMWEMKMFWMKMMWMNVKSYRELVDGSYEMESPYGHYEVEDMEDWEMSKMRGKNWEMKGDMRMWKKKMMRACDTCEEYKRMGSCRGDVMCKKWCKKCDTMRMKRWWQMVQTSICCCMLNIDCINALLLELNYLQFTFGCRTKLEYSSNMLLRGYEL
eukprot:TRINITY_DN11620_c0_g2_i2.p2 TRINITY_DN11620_c0_g2~~TRINITY_DN11620_c0_g2_i2.p2  ORF type:complete len:248 (+),score=37.22 TRINITY_DN11620_c0_g2_i2:66-809(+)